ncbi:MAG: OmpA family protein [Gemmatimonadota bacterium]
MRLRSHFIGSLPTTALTLFVVSLAAPEPAQGQFLDKLKDRAEEAAEQETLNQVDLLVRDKVQCVFNDFACMENARESGEEYVLTDPDGGVLVDDEGQPVSDPEQANGMMGGEAGGAPDLSTMKAGGEAPELNEANANYDFEPGDRVLFEDDYGNDNVGDFPRRMNFRNGNWDVVEWNGQRWLRNTGPRHAALDIPLNATLPESFTIEFDAYFPQTNQQLVVTTAPPPEGQTRVIHVSGNGFRVGVGGGRTGIIALEGGSVEAMVTTREVGEGPVPIRIMVDGQYAKMFVGTRRVANVPNAEFQRSDHLYMENIYSASEKNPMLIGPIRVAAGGRDLYDVLEREGRFTAEGIRFDVNSANIRTESAATLEEIGTMLQEHPDLRLSIEGHTDSDGDDAHNMQLSEDRAAGVRNLLIERFGIESSRLEAKGFGATVPIAPNDTDEGKQENRRVELVKL